MPTGQSLEARGALIDADFDGRNGTDRGGMIGCVTPNAVDHGPPSLSESLFQGAAGIAAKRRARPEPFGDKRR